jgi:hypothetical protein
MKNRLNIVSKLLIGIIAFQVLNLSVSNVPQYQEDPYLYTGSTQTGSDPTETMVELIVEARYGQQDMFTYKTSPEAGKNYGKTVCYQSDLINEEPETVLYPSYSQHPVFFDTAEKMKDVHGKINVPPPEI